MPNGRLASRRRDGDQQAEPDRRPFFRRHVEVADFTSTVKPCFSKAGRALALRR